MLAVRAVALAISVTLALPAAAAEPELSKDRRDLWITAGAGAVVLGLELAKGAIVPDGCRWCATNGLDDGVRRRLVWSDPKVARLTSDGIAGLALPAGAAAYLVLAARNGPGWREGAWDTVYVAEAAALSMTLNQIVKLAVVRQRPYAAHGNWAYADRKTTSDDNLSFWSSHTAVSFAIATSAGTIASMRGRDEAPWVWAIGLGAATAAGYFRIAADKHYLTDVLTGAVVGSAFGLAVPKLLHGKVEGPGQGATGLTVVPVPFGVAGTF
ncbi:MAG: phosphatase PAP2 family protein [Anaeromyxobacter sp.]